METLQNNQTGFVQEFKDVFEEQKEGFGAGLFAWIVTIAIALYCSGCTFRFETSTLYHGQTDLDGIRTIRDVSDIKGARGKVTEAKY